MDFLMATPYTLRVLIALGVLLGINKWTKNLTIAVAAGALVLAVWTGQSIAAIGSIAYTRASSIDNIVLMILIFLVIGMSSLMQKTGIMNDLVSQARGVLPKRTALAVLPAVIGLLPMPGGAIFSAPLLDTCDPQNHVTPIRKTTINHWFRHIWEYWWPVYPGVLLALELSGLPLWLFISALGPLSIVSVTAGYFFFLRHVPPVPSDKSGTFRTIIMLLLPIIVVIVSYISIQSLFPSIVAVSRYLPMTLGIFFAIVTLSIQRPLPLINFFHSFFSFRAFNMVLIVAMIRVYGAFIEAELPDGISLVEHMRMELSTIGVPLVLLIGLIPLITGVTTGIMVGVVGASFPIVLSLIGANPSMHVLLSTVVIAYTAGYLGMLLSPVHICLIVTNEHFKTRLIRSIMLMLKPASVIVIFSILIASGIYFL